MTNDHHSSTIDGSAVEPKQHVFQPDWGDYPNPSDAVVEAVAAVTNRSPLEMPPLYRFIDPEALDRLLDPSGAIAGEDVSVCFSYNGLELTVDDTISIREHAEPTAGD